MGRWKGKGAFHG